MAPFRSTIFWGMLWRTSWQVMLHICLRSPTSLCNKLAANSSLAFLVCVRLAVCEGIFRAANESRFDRCWTLNEIVQPSVEFKVQLLQARLQWCGHEVHRLARGRHRCSKCGTTKPARQFGSWLLQQCCPGSTDAAEPPVPVPKCRDA